VKINKIKVGVDYDCVLFDSTFAFISLFNEYTGLHYTMEDITEWDMRNIFPKEYKRLVEDLWVNPKLWERVQPLYESQLYMKKLSKDNDIDLYLITDTAPTILETKINIFKKEYPFINLHKHLFVCGNKQMVDVDIMVDDAVHNLVDGKYKKILLKYPWNQGFDVNKYQIDLAGDWADVYKYIQEYKSCIGGTNIDS